jgi:hypothetical protein
VVSTQSTTRYRYDIFFFFFFFYHEKGSISKKKVSFCKLNANKIGIPKAQRTTNGITYINIPTHGLPFKTLHPLDHLFIILFILHLPEDARP